VVVHLEGAEIARHQRSYAPADVVLDPRHARALRLAKEARARLEAGDVALEAVDLGRYDRLVSGSQSPAGWRRWACTARSRSCPARSRRQGSPPRPPPWPSGPAPRDGTTSNTWPRSWPRRWHPGGPRRRRPGQGRPLPQVKTLDDFDFSFQRSVRRQQLAHLAQLDFLREATNVVFLGPPGPARPT
jgi:hypothetical protein